MSQSLAVIETRTTKPHAVVVTRLKFDLLGPVQYEGALEAAVVEMTEVLTRHGFYLDEFAFVRRAVK